MTETERKKSRGHERQVLIDPLWLIEMELKVVEMMRLICDGGCHVDGGQYEVVENVFGEVENGTDQTNTSQRTEQDGRFKVSQFKKTEHMSDMMMYPLLPDNHYQQVYMFFTTIPQQTNHQAMNPPQSSVSTFPNTIQIMGEKRTILQIKRNSPSQQLQNNQNNIKTNNNNNNNFNSLQSMMQTMMMMGHENYQQQQQECFGNNGLVCSQESTNCSPVAFSLSEKKNKVNKFNEKNKVNKINKNGKKNQGQNKDKSNNIFGNTFNTVSNNNNEMGQIQINCQPTIFHDGFNYYNSQNQIVNQNVNQNNNINPIDIDTHLDRKEQQNHNHNHDNKGYTQIQNTTTQQTQQTSSFKRDSSGMNLPKSSNNNFNNDRRQQLVRLAAEEKEKIVKKKIQKRKKETRKLLLQEEDSDEEDQDEEGDGQGENNKLSRKVQSVGNNENKNSKNNNNGMGFSLVNNNGKTNNSNSINSINSININAHSIASNPFIANTTPLLTNINIIQTQQHPITRSLRLQSNKQLDKLISNYNQVCVDDGLEMNNKKRVKNNQSVIVEGNGNNKTIQNVQQHIRHVQQTQQQQQSYHNNQPIIITPALQINNYQQLQQTRYSYQHHQQHHQQHQHHQAHLHHINLNINNYNYNSNNNNILIDELIKNSTILNTDKLTVQQMMLADLLYYHPTYQMVHPNYTDADVNSNYTDVDVNSNMIDNHHYEKQYRHFEKQYRHFEQQKQQYYQQYQQHDQQQETTICTNSNTNTKLMRQLMQQFNELLTYQTNTIDEFNQFIVQKLFTLNKDQQNEKQNQKEIINYNNTQQYLQKQQQYLQKYPDNTYNNQPTKQYQSPITSQLTLQVFIQVLKQTQTKLTTQLLKQTNKLFYINIKQQQHHQPLMSLYQQVQNICNNHNKIGELMNQLQETILGEFQCNINKVMISNDNNRFDKKDGVQIKQQQLTGRQLQLYKLIKQYVSNNNININDNININMSNINYNNNIVSHAHYKHNQQIFNSMLNQFITLQQIDYSFIACGNNENINKDKNKDINKDKINDKEQNKNNQNNPSSPQVANQSQQVVNQSQRQSVTVTTTLQQQQQQQQNIKHKLTNYIQRTQTKVRQLQQTLNTIMYDVFEQSNNNNSNNNQHSQIQQMVNCTTGEVINYHPHYDMQNNHYNEFFKQIETNNQHINNLTKSSSFFIQSTSGSILTQQLYQASNLIQSVQRFIKRSSQSQNRQNNNNNSSNSVQQMTMSNIFNKNKTNNDDLDSVMVDQQQVQLIQTTISSIIKMLDHTLIDVELMKMMENSSQQ